MMVKRKEKPCKYHRAAYSNFSTIEVKGMMNQGLRFKQCMRCGWIIRNMKNNVGYNPHKATPCASHEIKSLNKDFIEARNLTATRCGTCGWYVGGEK